MPIKTLSGSSIKLYSNQINQAFIFNTFPAVSLSAAPTINDTPTHRDTENRDNTEKEGKSEFPS